jgi:RNA polymerase sigma-70 factor (ECF subfamily)
MLDNGLIPDERLRLIFVCCHPALSEGARIALTLKTVCRLDTAEIARAFLVSETTLAQRLVRAKRKIAEAGVPFEVPRPGMWGERLSAVLSTVEVAYAHAHADAAATGAHAGFGTEMLSLAALLVELLPGEPDVLALAAALFFAEARRPARMDAGGLMIPLAEQDPGRWDRGMIERGDAFLRRGFALAPQSVRLLKAGIHAAWCRRASLAEPPPWTKVLALYDGLLALREDPFVRLNRLVALAEVEGPIAALAELGGLDATRFAGHLPFQVLHADLLRRTGNRGGASEAYRRALALGPSSAERRWLQATMRKLER